MRDIIRLLAQLMVVIRCFARGTITLDAEYKDTLGINHPVHYTVGFAAVDGMVTVACKQLNKKVHVDAGSIVEAYLPVYAAFAAAMDRFERDGDQLVKVEPCDEDPHTDPLV